jgi:hypothetical protein
MEPKFTLARTTPALSPEQFAHLGDGMIAYVRPLRSEDIGRFYPDAPAVAPGLTLFALIGANGAPISIADSPEGALGSAREHDLRTVSLH